MQSSDSSDAKERSIADDRRLIRNLSSILRDESTSNSGSIEDLCNQKVPSNLDIEDTIDYSGHTSGQKGTNAINMDSTYLIEDPQQSISCPSVPSSEEELPPPKPKRDLIRQRAVLVTDSQEEIEIPSEELKPLENQHQYVSREDMKSPSFLNFQTLYDGKSTSDDDDNELSKKRRRSIKELNTVNIDYDWMDVSHLTATEESDSSITVPLSILTLSNEQLRSRLIKLGECPGPISEYTRCVYQKYVAKIEKNNNKHIKVRAIMFVLIYSETQL